MICTIGVVAVMRKARATLPTVPNPIPRVANPRVPYRSESLPLIGPIHTKATSNGRKRIPAVRASYPRITWKYKIMMRLTEPKPREYKS